MKNKSTIHEMIQNAKRVAVIPSKIAGVDAFCAAVGLYSMLKKTGKGVNFIYQGKVPDEVVKIIPDDEITRNIKERNLQIRVDYSMTNAGKVHYSTDEDVLTLLLGPIPNDFDHEKMVSTSLVGFDFDLIFTVGLQSVQDLGQTYRVLENKFDNAQIINIDNLSTNEKFGVKNVIDVNSSSLSVLVFKLASKWGLEPDISAANAILKGISLIK